MRYFWALILVLGFFTSMQAKDTSGTTKTQQEMSNAQGDTGSVIFPGGIIFHALVQAQATFSASYKEGESFRDEKNVEKEYYIKRAVISLEGKTTERIELFLGLEDNSIGKNSEGVYENTEDSSSKAFFQDAYVSCSIMQGLSLTAGMFRLPFSRQNLESPESILGVDFQEHFVGSALSGSTSNWRDTGLMVHGLYELPGCYVEARAGVFQGRTATDDINENDMPRYTGRLQVNLFDPDTGFLYRGFYTEGQVLTFGAGIDFQQEILDQGEDKDPLHYMAWTADAIADFPLGASRISFEAGYMNVVNKPETVNLGYHKSYGIYAQAGFLMWKTVQPIVKYDRIVPDSEESRAQSSIISGLNYYIKDINACIKIEYAYPLGDNYDVCSERYGTIALQAYL